MAPVRAVTDLRVVTLKFCRLTEIQLTVVFIDDTDTLTLLTHHITIFKLHVSTKIHKEVTQRGQQQ